MAGNEGEGGVKPAGGEELHTDLHPKYRWVGVRQKPPVEIGDVVEVKIDEMLEPEYGMARIRWGEHRTYRIFVKGGGFGVGDTVKARIINLGPADAEAIIE